MTRRESFVSILTKAAYKCGRPIPCNIKMLFQLSCEKRWCLAQMKEMKKTKNKKLLCRRHEHEIRYGTVQGSLVLATMESQIQNILSALPKLISSGVELNHNARWNSFSWCENAIQHFNIISRKLCWLICNRYCLVLVRSLFFNSNPVKVMMTRRVKFKEIVNQFWELM